MPTYQYACTECDHAFEQFQSFTDDSLTVCPACNGRLRKLFNAVGVVFKGSGFYRTDNRSSNGNSSSGTSSGTSSSTSGTGDSGSAKKETAASSSSSTTSTSTGTSTGSASPA